jgi:hypothetical protein
MQIALSVNCLIIGATPDRRGWFGLRRLMMPKYMLLFYAGEADAEEQAAREAQLPEMIEVAAGLQDAGVLLAADRLYPVEDATTVRVRGGAVELVDGPFAITKEYLGGYFILECADLDEALRHAASLPLAEYGSVEVRPVLDVGLRSAAGRDAPES